MSSLDKPAKISWQSLFVCLAASILICTGMTQVYAGKLPKTALPLLKPWGLIRTSVDNVENAAAAIIGRETVQYVSNIYKYYIAYSLVEQQRDSSTKARKAMETAK